MKPQTNDRDRVFEEMLQALKAVKHLINSGDFHDQTKRLKVWEQVDRAVAKAEGREFV